MKQTASENEYYGMTKIFGHNKAKKSFSEEMRGSPDKEHCTNMELRQSSGSGNLVAIEKKRKSDDFFGQKH